MATSGLSTTPDEEGYFTYTRPEGKSGGHGVGWSEVPRYSFKVPAERGWEETPVSIADLGGTEIDLRYTSSQQGNISVVVAPIMRFADISFNANMTIEKLGDPEKIIRGFAPELYGAPLDDEDILDITVNKNGPLTYYYYKLKRDRLVAATAVKNRLFLLAITSTSRQSKKFADQLVHIRDSFYVQNEVVKPVDV